MDKSGQFIALSFTLVVSLMLIGAISIELSLLTYTNTIYSMNSVSASTYNLADNVLYQTLLLYNNSGTAAAKSLLSSSISNFTAIYYPSYIFSENGLVIVISSQSFYTSRKI